MVEELKYAQIQVFGVEDEPVNLDGAPEEDEEEDEDDEEDDEEDEDEKEDEEEGWQN